MRGAVAGAVAAAIWAAAEPALGRVCGTPFSDVRLLGRAITRGRAWPLVGLVAHIGNGAAFGFGFERLALRGIRSGVLAANLENLALWPGMAVVDRFHPDRRAGIWPPLFANAAAFRYEVTMHTLFGAMLGALVRES